MLVRLLFWKEEEEEEDEEETEVIREKEEEKKERTNKQNPSHVLNREEEEEKTEEIFVRSLSARRRRRRRKRFIKLAMAASPCRFVALLFLCILQSSRILPSSARLSRNSPTINSYIIKNTSSAVQAELHGHGFPVGLIPATVLSYDLDENSGSFEVKLLAPCHFTIPGDRPYPVSYATSISGTIKNGYMHDLNGVSVRAMYKWWTISAIRSSTSNGQVAFEIGPISVNYPASNFDDIPECEKATGSRSSVWRKIYQYQVHRNLMQSHCSLLENLYPMNQSMSTYPHESIHEDDVFPWVDPCVGVCSHE